jgi:hypothetical protein
MYRLINRDTSDGRIDDGVHFSANMIPTVLDDFPEVENGVRIRDIGYEAGSNEIRIEDQQIQLMQKVSPMRINP